MGSINASIERPVHSPIRLDRKRHAGSLFNPNSIPGLRQQLFVGSTPPTSGAIADERTVIGSVRTPQPGRAYLFDGVDDYISFTNLSLNDFSVSAWINPDNLTGGTIIGSNVSGAPYVRITSTNIVFRVGSVNHTITTNPDFTTNAWQHFAFMRSGSSISAYRNGVLIGTTTALTEAWVVNRIGVFSTASFPFSGDLFDLRLYSDELTANEVSYLCTFGESGTNPGIANLSLLMKCDDTNSTVAYNSAGSGNHGTKTNVNAVTFHYTGKDVPHSWLNEIGFTDDATNGLVPRDESNTALDVLGGSLEYNGKCPINGQSVQSPCGSADGVDDYIAVASLTGAETVVSKQGTATATIAAGRINLTAGTIYDLLLSNGSHYPICERSGVTVHDVSVHGRHGTITNAVTTAGTGFWAATQNTFHWALANGFRASSGAEIPALSSGASAADGSAITNFAGAWHNGGVTKIDTTQGINLAGSSSWETAWSYNSARVNPRFKRTNGSYKADRFLNFAAALSGDDLTNVDSYTATI